MNVQKKVLMMVGALAAIIIFQNCGQSFEDAGETSSGQINQSSGGGSQEVTSIPTPQVNPGVSPPPPSKIIPTEAILDIRHTNLLGGSTVCPSGLQKFRDHLGYHSVGELCYRKYNGEVNPMVVSDIVAYVESVGCPTGYETLTVQRFSATQLRACIKYEPAQQAQQFITGVRYGAVSSTGIDSTCRPWEKVIRAPGVFGTSTDVVVCYFPYNAQGRPWRAIESVSLPLETQGCPIGAQAVYNPRGYGRNAPLGSTVICASYAEPSSNRLFVTDISAPGEGQSCPVGFELVGDLVNNTVPNRRFPICVRRQTLSAEVSGVGLIYLALPVTSLLYLEPLPCRAVEKKIGVMPIYQGGIGVDSLIGATDFCMAR